MGPLVYVIACTYTSFFAISLGSLYRLTPTASSAFSLLFNGTMMARFGTPPVIRLCGWYSESNGNVNDRLACLGHIWSVPSRPVGRRGLQRAPRSLFAPFLTYTGFFCPNLPDPV